MVCRAGRMAGFLRPRRGWMEGSMRTMAEMAAGLAAAITGWRVRMALVLVGFFVGAATARAGCER